MVQRAQLQPARTAAGLAFKFAPLDERSQRVRRDSRARIDASLTRITDSNPAGHRSRSGLRAFAATRNSRTRSGAAPASGRVRTSILSPRACQAQCGRISSGITRARKREKWRALCVWLRIRLSVPMRGSIRLTVLQAVTR
jgi:hypothetical protein